MTGTYPAIIRQGKVAVLHVGHSSLFTSCDLYFITYIYVVGAFALFFTQKMMHTLTDKK
jgi:hypothetical protein